VLEAYQVPFDCTFGPSNVRNIVDQVWAILGITGLDEVTVEFESSFHEFDPATPGNVLPYFMGTSDEFWSFAPPPPASLDAAAASYFALPDWTIGISTADWPALVSAQFVPNISVDALLNYLEMSEYDKQRRALYEAQPGYMTGSEDVGWADGRRLQEEFDHNSDPDPVYNPWESADRQFLNVSNCSGSLHYIVRLSIGTYNMTDRNEFVRIFNEQRLNASVCGDDGCNTCMERCSLGPAIFNSRRVFFAPAPPPDGVILEEQYTFVGVGLVGIGFIVVILFAVIGQLFFRAPPAPGCDAPPLPAPYGLYGRLHIPASWLWFLHPHDKRLLHKRGARVCDEANEALVPPHIR
tara:strand:- start:148 stop:1203 length:1056 start_codon:yes stop_codon:yes gene_type:complete